MKRNDLDQFLRYARRARLEFTLLLILSFAFLILPKFYDPLFGESIVTDFSETEKAAASIFEIIKSEGEERKKKFAAKGIKSSDYTSGKKSNKNYYSKKKAKGNNLIPSKLFKFDPNQITKEDFISLGFSNKVASTILNYREKGGKFYTKEDFKRIYGVSESDYNTIEPFLDIEQELKNFDKPKNLKKSKPLNEKNDWAEIKIDINRATPKDWEKLRGIGPYYAKRITTYRDKLGGFSSIEQVGTTYGLKDSTFRIIKPFLELSPILKKIKINVVSPEELKAHPLISRKQAEVLVKFRKNHGDFADSEALKKVIILSQEDLKKLLPYLDFSPK